MEAKIIASGETFDDFLIIEWTDKKKGFGEVSFHWDKELHRYTIDSEYMGIQHVLEVIKALDVPSATTWIEYNWDKPETRPTEYGKHLIVRKDGKIHWETWNGSGWAYNGKVIKYWAKINPPISNVEKQKDDYSKDKNFWKRLKSFVEDIEVSDACGYEEKEMLLHVCNKKI